ncbi:MAG: CapA family protein [Parasporobacterium sp.]|nr:CapA family protein [Parasporobacterium sp.]
MARRTPRDSYDEPVRRTSDRQIQYRNEYGDGRPRPASRPAGRPAGTRSGGQYPSERKPSARYGSERRPVYSESRRSAAPVRRRRKKSKAPLVAVIIIVILIAGGAFAAWKTGVFSNKPQQVVDEIKPVPAAPAVISTASIGSTGDVILHTPILDAQWNGYEYDFSNVFANVSRIYNETDLMFANLEVTLGGPEYGEYSGYPAFNSPDDIVPALKNAGVDVCLTANNHCNDTGYNGMMRTLQVLDEYGMEHLGTRQSSDESFIMVKNINGIRLGLICYTYDTREYTDWEMSLNGGILNSEAIDKVNTFSYAAIEEFYSDISRQLYYMDMLNVDAKVVFLHWGTEYMDYPNDDQATISQRLCDMGVDVLIGGHPHVIQEFDTMTSASGHEMVCLYSMGNQLSNQRVDIMEAEDGGRGYTEDGLVMQVTFEKFNNGRVKVGAVNIVPTWVQLDGAGYQIIGMEGSDPWSWGANDTYSAIASYNRTLGRVGDSYIAYRVSKNQSEVTTYIE